MSSFLSECLLSNVVLKEETDRTGSILKQDSILGQTVDFELYAQYLWK